MNVIIHAVLDARGAADKDVPVRAQEIAREIALVVVLEDAILDALEQQKAIVTLVEEYAHHHARDFVKERARQDVLVVVPQAVRVHARADVQVIANQDVQVHVIQVVVAHVRAFVQEHVVALVVMDAVWDVQ